MKIEDQVCTLGQAKKLKSLGISIPCSFGYIEIPSNGLSVHYYWRNDKYALINADIVMFMGNGEERWYAPTVAELGVMLPEFIPSKTERSLRLQQWSMARRDTFRLQYREKADEIGDIDIPFQYDYPNEPTEAQARAKMLIYLLENKHLTIESVNQSLTP